MSEYLNVLLSIFEGKDYYSEFFEALEGKTFSSEVSLEHDESFDYTSYLKEHKSPTNAIKFLYDSDNHMLIRALVEFAIENDFFIIDEYNRLEKEFKEDPSSLGFDVESLEELEEAIPYLYMSDVNIYEVQTRNYKYRFEYCRGEEWFGELELVTVDDIYNPSIESPKEEESPKENEGLEEIEEDDSKVQLYLTSMRPIPATKIECPECQKTETLSGYMRLRTNRGSIYCYQYQCQNCGEFHYSDEKGEGGIIVALKERCKCSGQFRRDKDIFCSCGYRKNELNREEDFLYVDQDYINDLNDKNETPRS